MAFLSTSAGSILKPEEIHELIVLPTMEQSVAMRQATVVPTDTAEFRFPVVTEDASAGWYNEGEDIELSDPTVDEVIAKPKKIASLTKVSRELAEDSSPEATALVGASVARDIARKIDSAWIAASTPKGPAGLASLIGSASSVLGGSYANLDAFTEAATLLEGVGSTVTSWATSSTTALALASLKEETGSNKALLQPDPTQPTRRTIAGAPLYVIPGPAGLALEDDVVWGVDKSRAFVVLRRDVDLAVDESFFFGSDSLAVRCTMRIDFGFPAPQSVVRVGPDGS